MIKNIKFTIVIIVLMLFFSSFLVAVPTKASYVSLVIRGADGDPTPRWVNKEYSMTFSVDNIGDENAYGVTVILDYDETNITITSTKAGWQYGNLIYGTDDGDKVTWNNVAISKPIEPPEDNTTPPSNYDIATFQTYVKYVIYNDCLIKGSIIENKITVDYFDPIGSGYYRTTSGSKNIKVLNDKICGFNVENKIRKYNGDEIQWLNEKTVLKEDNVHFKINIENTLDYNIYVGKIKYLLPSGLQYVSGTSIVNEEAKEPSVNVLPSGTTILTWNFPRILEIPVVYTGQVDSGQNFAIEFDTTAVEYGDWNGEVRVWAITYKFYQSTPWDDFTTIANDNAIVHVSEKAEPTLRYKYESHDFGVMQEGEAASCTFRIWNGGTGVLSYNLAPHPGDEGWISFSPTSGECGEQGDVITVDIVTPSLHNLHIGKIIINSNGGYGEFRVSVKTGDPDSPPCLAYSNPWYAEFDTVEDVYDKIAFEIWNDCTGKLTYELSEDCDWISSISPASGSVTVEHDYIRLTIDKNYLTEGTNTCSINITSNGGNATYEITFIIGDDQPPQNPPDDDDPPENPDDPPQDQDPSDDDPPVSDNIEPTIILNAPQNGKIYLRGEEKNIGELFKTIIIGPITIKADAIDTDGDISKVEFIINDEIKQTLTSGPYEYYWNERTFGISYIKIKAYDNKGAVSEIEFDALVINLGLSK